MPQSQMINDKLKELVGPVQTEPFYSFILGLSRLIRSSHLASECNSECKKVSQMTVIRFCVAHVQTTTSITFVSITKVLAQNQQVHSRSISTCLQANQLSYTLLQPFGKFTDIMEEATVYTLKTSLR